MGRSSGRRGRCFRFSVCFGFVWRIIKGKVRFVTAISLRREELENIKFFPGSVYDNMFVWRVCRYSIDQTNKNYFLILLKRNCTILSFQCSSFISTFMSIRCRYANAFSFTPFHRYPCEKDLVLARQRWYQAAYIFLFREQLNCETILEVPRRICRGCWRVVLNAGVLIVWATKWSSKSFLSSNTTTSEAWDWRAVASTKFQKNRSCGRRLVLETWKLFSIIVSRIN